MMRPASPKIGLYIHVPFCLRKCLYCDFCSFPGQSQDVIDAYVSALCRELTQSAPRLADRVVDTVYFGGGTPSLLQPEQFDKILSCVAKTARLADDVEITAECNPATVTREKLRGMRAAGLNRLSVGVQSLCDDELHALGRLHTAQNALQTLADAEAAGFTNVSCDLMFGIPKQTADSFAGTLQTILSTGVSHLSVYGLILEEKTPFWAVRDSLPLPDEETERGMYMTAIETLKRAGIPQYEISNFARPGYESRHNLKYWNGDEYLGLGVAAHSFMDGVRFAHGDDLTAYLNGSDSTAVCEKEDRFSAACEYVMLRLRLCAGVDERDFTARFGLPFTPFAEKLSAYLPAAMPCAETLLIHNESNWRFTPAGFYVSNTILSDLPDADELRAALGC